MRLVVSLAAGPASVVVPVLMAAEFLNGLSMPVFNINFLSLRQAMAPGHLQGRINATVRFPIWVATPLGAAAGGLLAARVGLRPVLILAAIATCAATLLMFASSKPLLDSFAETPPAA